MNNGNETNPNPNNTAVTGLQNAQREGNLRKDSNVQKNKGSIGSRNSNSGLSKSSSKSSNNVNVSGNNGARSLNNSQKLSNKNSFGASNKGNKVGGKKSAKASTLASNLLNKNGKGQLTKGNLPGVTTAGRIYNALNTGKNLAKRAAAKVSANAESRSDSMNPESDKGENNNPLSQNNQEMNFQDMTIKIPRIVKVVAIVASCFIVMVFVLVASLINTDTVRKLIIQKFALEALGLDDDGDGPAVDSATGEDHSDELGVITLEKKYTVYLKGNIKSNQSFIDDSVTKKGKFLSYTSSEQVNLNSLKKYYKINCKTKADCEKTDLYRFYRKFYDIYFLYKYKYNVKLNLALLMATLDYNSTEQEELFKRNLNDYDTSEVRENNYDNDNITNLDWEYDYKNIDGYKYLNAKDFRYDMQILAKNMVTKKIKYTCSGSGSSNSGSASKVITNNSNTGNGWNSVTTVKYNNGIERTYRNYKQYEGTYSNQSFWKSGTYKTISGAGCGPTSVAIVLSGYGYDANPGKVVKVMQDEFNKDDAADFKNLTEPLKYIGNIDAEIHSGQATTADIKIIRDNFKKGRPVIINAPNHYVVYVGEDKNGKLIISDPGSSDGGNARYGATLEDVINNGNITYGYILIKSDGKATKSKNSKASSSEEVTKDGDYNVMTDIETSNYDKKLKCDSGTVDKDSIESSYELDLDKYDEFLLEYIEHKFYLEGAKVDKGADSDSADVSGSGKLTIDATNHNLCKGTVTPGVYQNSEPCPNMAILYWKQYLKQSDFVFPKDKKTGLPLGAWPKNYSKYPTQLKGYKTYHKYYIWPITPVNNTYTTVYTHQSMDIMSKFGTPVYSPVDGTLVYSEWEHTPNRGSDETAYSVTITPTNTITYGGTAINEIFLTHMSGIRYRCSWGKCNRKVKKGELLGFSGNAAGTAQSVGWAPHLHMTFYNSSSYSGTGLYTPTLEKFYNIKNNTKRKVGE